MGVAAVLSILAFLLPLGYGQGLTVQQAIDEALKKSPVVHQAKSQVEQSAWQQVESYAGFLPTVTLDAAYLTSHRYALTDIDLGGGPLSVPQVIPTSALAVNARWPLFDGFASTNRYKAARKMASAVENLSDWTQFEVSRKVTLLFYKALGAKILKTVAEQNIKTLEDHLNDVRLFKKAGASTKYDVLRVEVQVSEAQSELLNAQDNEASGKALLAEVLGQEAEERDLEGSLPVLQAAIVDGVKADGIKGRRDLTALRQRTEGLDYLNTATKNFWVPRFNLVGQYLKYNNRNDRLDDVDNYREAYQVGLNMTWNIFDGMVTIAKSREAIEEKFQAEKKLEIARLKARQQFEFWRRKFIYYSSVYSARVSDMAKADESVRLAKEGRRVGARTNTDLLDAESELFRARAGKVGAQVGAVEALVNLELTTGQKLYEFK